jgi:hypothetical protein
MTARVPSTAPLQMFAAFVLLHGVVIDLHDDDDVRAYARDTWVPMLLGPT